MTCVNSQHATKHSAYQEGRIKGIAEINWQETPAIMLAGQAQKETLNTA